MSFKAFVHRYKVCICIVPLIFNFYIITGIMLVAIGIVDIIVANKAPYYFREAMRSIYKHGHVELIKMKKDARMVAFIWIISGIILIAIEAYFYCLYLF